MLQVMPSGGELCPVVGRLVIPPSMTTQAIQKHLDGPGSQMKKNWGSLSSIAGRIGPKTCSVYFSRVFLA